MGQSLQDWADGYCSSQTLDQLVADVAGFQIREDERIRSARNRTARRFALANCGNERGICLQLAVDKELWRARAEGAGCLDDLINQRMTCASFGREREHRHARLDLKQRSGGFRRSDCDLGKLGGGRLDDDAAVGEDKRAALSELASGNDHQEEARDDLQAGLWPYALERCTHGVPGCV